MGSPQGSDSWGKEMRDESGNRSRPSCTDESRREFLKKGGAALAAGTVLSSLPTVADSDREEGSHGERVTHRSWNRPNLLILITDQERHPQHWPEGWADANLPNRKRLSDRGLTFTRAFCAASMCTPSRATLFTGLFAPEHKVTQTLRYGTGPTAASQHTLPLPDTIENMATMLAKAGYDVQYRGKWHISKDPSGIQGVGAPWDLERYGFNGWVPPEGGTDQSPAVFGGGNTNYDTRYTDQAVDFLKNAKARSAKPFALFLCLINPHDVMSYPGVPPIGWDSKSLSDIEPDTGKWNYKGVDLSAPPLDQIGLPESFGEPAEGNFKPAAQAQSTQFWGDSRVCGPIDTEEKAREYARFYAYLHQKSDEQYGKVLDALESRNSIYHNTLVIRLSDHGEMGLAHGGMRQKAYSAYEETIHVPLVISNPRLFPGPVQTPALASLVDLMPTLATIADVPGRSGMAFRGKDLTPILQDAVDHPDLPPRSVQDSVLFTTDENLGSLLTEPDDSTEPIVKEPSRIRCLREERWKITLYFSASDPQVREYELYDMLNDPYELHNRADSANQGYYDPVKLEEMKAKLEAKMEETHTIPAPES
jgi:arylsulfatase A-like enzyme